MGSISKPGFYIYKNKGYMVTAFCDRVFVIGAISGFLVGLLVEGLVFWSGSFT